MSDQPEIPPAAVQAAPVDPAVAQAQKQSAAEQEYQRILSFYEADEQPETHKKAIVRAIVAGRIIMDESKGTLAYNLAMPIELLNHEILDHLVFREPNSSELEYVNRGSKMQINVEGEKFANMDQGDIYSRRARFLSKVCDLPLGVTGRIMARDSTVVQAICDFFA
jgi:hypothetical protein